MLGRVLDAGDFAAPLYRGAIVAALDSLDSLSAGLSADRTKLAAALDRDQRRVGREQLGHRRQLIVEIGPELVVAGNGQIALGLDDEEAAGHAGGELLLFRLETLFGQGARCTRRADPRDAADDAG